MMEMTTLQRQIAELLPDIDILYNEPMEKHTSFHIGGNAEIMVLPRDTDSLREILRACERCKVQPRILGAGTNILAPDDGIAGVVVCLKDALNELKQIGDTQIYASAGVTMSRAAVFAASHSLGGMEFAHGIPGTVGGGVYMNAGAYDGEIADICLYADLMRPDGTVVRVSGADMEFSYRHSRLENSADIVLGAAFQLVSRPEAEIREKMQSLLSRRKASQPLDMPSAGSAFKRPKGGYAAALIDEAGLRGYRVGDAAVSEKHTGFAVNLGNATASDVTKLLQNVSDIVFERFGIRLEPEIRIW